MTDIVIILILAAVLGLAAAYVIREKKKGRKCIGCPGGCPGGCGGCSQGGVCHHGETDEE